MGLFLTALVTHLLIILVAGSGHSGFGATFRVVAYSSVTSLAGWLPFIGWIFSLYRLYLATVGIREMHATTTGRALLVGHSFGGLYAQTYAARYAEEVAGVCLVESSSPEQFGHRPAARDSHEPPTRKFAVASLLARIGVVRLLYELVPAPPELPPRQRAQIDAIGPSTRQVSTTALELRAGPQTATQARGLRSLGDKPLAVVSAGTQEPEWLELQDGLATLSSNSVHRVLEGATHTSVLHDEGDSRSTSAAIVGVVEAVRKDRSLARQKP